MAQGREEEAFDFIRKYHGESYSVFEFNSICINRAIIGNGDPKHPLVKLQVEEFRDKIRTDGSDKRWWDFRCEALFLSISKLNLTMILRNRALFGMRFACSRYLV